MGLFGQLFGQNREEEMPGLLSAVERAVMTVEPLLIQSGGYPNNYRKSVGAALAYCRSLAAGIPGPVALSRESFARDAFIHAIFPSADAIEEAFYTSCALQGYYHEFPAAPELYALMGMRRCEKKMMGMELVGEMVQRDVAQKVIYFTSHTLENPAQNEAQARDLAAWSFFDCLTLKVKKRIEARKQERLSLSQQKDILAARLRAADAAARPALEEEMSRLIAATQAAAHALELQNYIEDFEAVLLEPERHLWLDKIPLVLDNMGIERECTDANREDAVVFNELIGLDRRNWVVTVVHCGSLPIESFAERLEKAYRRLAI